MTKLLLWHRWQPVISIDDSSIVISIDSIDNVMAMCGNDDERNDDISNEIWQKAVLLMKALVLITM